ncbi:unnamed protein product [Brugia timori]|uniref:Uncharacterized protein n=1 Tax=Brugia timori TaxID=42155 RepID=A0A3P7YF71_9BILA|nr:unnamed protein product [Brugia timori]
MLPKVITFPSSVFPLLLRQLKSDTSSGTALFTSVFLKNNDERRLRCFRPNAAFSKESFICENKHFKLSTNKRVAMNVSTNKN